VNLFANIHWNYESTGEKLYVCNIVSHQIFIDNQQNMIIITQIISNTNNQLMQMISKIKAINSKKLANASQKI
jgi:hypothetical protein